MASIPTPASQWKKADQTGQPEPLEMPSGNTALVQRPGVQAFLVQGLIPNSLMSIIQKAMKSNKEPDFDKAFQEMMDDPTKLADVFSLADAVTVATVVEPRVLPVPPKGEDRDPDLLYVDQVDLEDKLFILNYAVGGTRDLERFREEQEESVELVSSGAGVGDKAKPARRSSKRKS